MSVFDPTKDLVFPATRWPLFWMHEQSGKMARIVKKFLNDEPLDPEDLTVLRWYVYQWCDKMPNKPDDYERILTMSQAEIKAYNWTVLVTKYAIDPF